MKTQQIAYYQNEWHPIGAASDFPAELAQLVFAFGDRLILESAPPFEHIKRMYPNATIVINSTAGEIFDDVVNTDSIIVNAIYFEKTSIRAHELDIHHHLESADIGTQMGKNLEGDDLSAIFIISDGSVVNGSAFVSALNQATHHAVPISGGLAGDGARFELTLVGLNKHPTAGKIIGIGFYGTELKIGHGSVGGWDTFGPERETTKSEYNVLYKIGDKAALDLYKDYLGKYADELPGAALLFPLSIRMSEAEEPVVRTIVSIDETNKSMTFAGEIPQGARARFMTANFDRLIHASYLAAQESIDTSRAPDFAILVSCVGRKLVLGQRIDEEIEAARELFTEQTVVTGFYSYGEISSQNPTARCGLHNQTITITTFTEG